MLRGDPNGCAAVLERAKKKATHQNVFLGVLTPHSLPPHVESALMDMKRRNHCQFDLMVELNQWSEQRVRSREQRAWESSFLPYLRALRSGGSYALRRGGAGGDGL